MQKKTFEASKAFIKSKCKKSQFQNFKINIKPHLGASAVKGKKGPLVGHNILFFDFFRKIGFFFGGC